MSRFRFQDLEIWKMAMGITGRLFEIADGLEDQKLFRFSEQLRGAGMSISNNIAEGSGSGSKAQFRKYLDFARGSTFETANIVILLQNRNYLDPSTAESLLNDLESLSGRIPTLKKVI
jgi:four helix bundle protein